MTLYHCLRYFIRESSKIPSLIYCIKHLTNKANYLTTMSLSQ